jgi:quercetin dioxygenase-like cupin family protein
MRRKLVFGIVLVALGVVGVLYAQQNYPDAPEPAVVLDNAKVVVQRVEMEPGEWVGEHSHPGNQVVISLSDMSLMYKVDGKETKRTFEVGEVMWVDAGKHDHKALTEGAAILVTVK